MEAKFVSLVIAAIASSDVAGFFLQNFIFGKRIKKLEQKLAQDNETFRYKFHKQQNVENALVDAMNDLDRELVKIDGWLDRKIRLNLEPVMDLVGEFYLLRVLGIDRDLTEILGCCA